MTPLTAEAAGRRSKPKLLIVDDQPLNIRILHELFRQDCETLMATSGAQALQLALTQQPDLILLDVMMPQLDGHEVLRRLQADPATAAIPVIFVTGQEGPDEEVTGLELGAVDFISKPINPVIVRARVRTQLTLKAQRDALRSIALVDGLTGVANRRQFDEALLRGWRQSQREGTPFSLILMDIDHFKAYNDHYGHLAGDQCLRQVAQALGQGLFRPYDLLARYGGEEFGCLLPGTDLEGATQVAERLLQQVRDQRLTHGYSSVTGYVTLSLGVATALPPTAVDPAALITAADAQLYAAKHQGRARVCAAELAG
ncbi:response regulator receiver modulated diguanylate cyclase [Pseudomonas psychrotolerans L19]|uniref:diguanylate cyclase domain-containing protein n=1 Tax=Pseudomonas TaxID=286 RepID=UPI00023A1C45|nr:MULTISPECIES: diguanylate cyclase [Pseudomonas]EHK70464.1 response regulator receiver modulated diguanylate cyclase [Pseudomonas psychrotolerans L19]MBA1180913.1 diguanylate cyclase [Pseudomonas psychrotolerans]MBA1209876.1 diguanylate cyclase [Pseudomonas psychrotolerans]TCQ85014.1 response regulator receiver modulated diguanylate cyclase [Pseudomonas sp. JUb52]